ncbi:hypothetical protein LSUB1_G001208 [Lachnellula subtilissima]|uniref:Uncharacterized protein n=1 Tax=Lachnellula subtilissima TaxID=602034 RepID=A0A8H8RX16_9HELO|nr:hypothetical protein LSUB1_G001208 [Lachnellula subtilissima]
MSSRPQSPPNGMRAPPSPEAPKESAISRLLIAPLTFISFLLSLALIDSRNHALRTHTHNNAPPPPFARIKALFHSLIFKRVADPSPYSYVRSPDLKSESRDGNGNVEGKEEPWHWHTKQRKMMKAEMDDAFRMRKSVMVFLMLVGVGIAVAVGVIGRWILRGVLL